MSAILDQAKALSLEERLQLVGDIWDSIADESALRLTNEEVAEFDRRCAYADQHPESLLTWEQVERNARSHRG